MTAVKERVAYGARCVGERQKAGFAAVLNTATLSPQRAF
jgi:hypothetical protein